VPRPFLPNVGGRLNGPTRTGIDEILRDDNSYDAVDRLRAPPTMTRPRTPLSFSQSGAGTSLLRGPHPCFGWNARVSSARVLESAVHRGNLIPFAAAHPQARVVGLIFRPGARSRLGLARVAGLGLDNVEFVAGDARMDLTALGGSTSSSPRRVQLGAAGRAGSAVCPLSAGGWLPTAWGYLSYNVYRAGRPAGHSRCHAIGRRPSATPERGPASPHHVYFL